MGRVKGEENDEFAQYQDKSTIPEASCLVTIEIFHQ